jgi:Cu(I)/Ag(I) efflux system membrane fusion protein
MNTKSLNAIIFAAVSLFAFALHGADSPALSEPVKSVYDHYLRIQGALAQDSLKGVQDNANTIMNTVRKDDVDRFPAALAPQAETLSKEGDLAAARKAFKPLSNSLIKYLADNKVPKGTYYEVYCPMADASWLQANKDVKNPYLGKAMPDCGVIKD